MSRFLMVDERWAMGKAKRTGSVRPSFSVRRQSKIRNQGAETAFTLIEVLIVVAIIGIAGAIVVPQMLTAGTLGVQAAARMVIADLLYAQNEAIANQATRKVIFNVAENRYRLADASDTTLSVDWKGGEGENYVIDFNRRASEFGRVRIKSADFAGESQIAFDALGSPSSGGTVELEYRDTTYRITVAAFTGRVTVQKL